MEKVQHARNQIEIIAVGGQVQQEVSASDIVKKTVAAIGYSPRKKIEVDLTSTGLMTVGSSQAQVKAGMGANRCRG